LWIALTLLLLLFLTAKTGPAKTEAVISIKVIVAIANSAHFVFRFAITSNTIPYIL
jgi:hypothetical protein